MTVQEALAKARIKLQNSSQAGKPVSSTPSLDASIILSHVSGISRTQLMTHPEKDITVYEDAFLSAIVKRCSGLPVAYITGVKEFWGIDFIVTPAVLIPKPDTEILVERALEILTTKTESTKPTRILDACTGSGCVVISLAVSFKQIDCTAFDISTEALKIARTNAEHILGSKNTIRFLHHDVRNAFPRPLGASSSSYDLIVSNPPYVPSGTALELLLDGRGEPLLALDGGLDGLKLIRPLAEHAKKALAKGGTLLIETGEYNARAAAAYLKTLGFTDILVHTDLAGQDRVVEGVFQ